VNAVRQIADLEFVNGGGTGSIERTVREKAVTEVAAGSGLFHPRLFDFYRGFTGRPAAMFALPVVRRPAPGTVTVLGGGYIASGPPGPARVPQPYLPAGLRYSPDEGAGEVHTPLTGQAPQDLRAGDPVRFRHAKAGELCERFDPLHLAAGATVVETLPTYRRRRRRHSTQAAPSTSTAPTPISTGPRPGSSSHTRSGSLPGSTGRGASPSASPTCDASSPARVFTSATVRSATRFGLTRSAMASTVCANSARVRAIRRSSSSGSVSAMTLLPARSCSCRSVCQV